MLEELTINVEETSRGEIDLSRSNVSAWVSQHIGPNRAFRNNDALAKAAGLHPKTIGNLIGGAKPEPETLVKIADAVGTSRFAVFVIAGWLNPSDIHGAMRPGLDNLLRMWYLLPESSRRVWLRLGEGLVGLLGMSISEFPEAN